MQPSFDERLALAMSEGIARDDLPSRAPTFEPLVGLSGNYNFRDAGGYSTRSGRTMRRGLVFRSDHLADLTDGDVDIVAGLGIRTVYDFRLESERIRQPSRLPLGDEAPDVVLLGTSDFNAVDESVIDVIRDMLAGLRPLPSADFWEHNYLDMLNVAQLMLVGYVRSVAAIDRLPSVHHCTGGKDRTGLATALLHRLLGVSDADIVDDFLRTNLYRTPSRAAALRPGLAEKGIDVADALGVLGVTRASMVGVLNRWDGGGGAEAYALDGGLTGAELQRVRDNLLS